MHDEISYSQLFADIDKIISYLKALNAPDDYIKTLQQTQSALLALELINLSTYSTNLT